MLLVSDMPRPVYAVVRPHITAHHPPRKRNGWFYYKPTKWEEKVRKCIMWRESRNTNAKPNYASASGYYQFIDSTWKHYKGYSKAYQAPYRVQTARFWMIFQHGKGKMAWNYPPHQCW